MKDALKIKNYREKYKRYYGIDFGRDFEVHHIDLNHENNDINNLVLLPKELHHRYHFYLNVARDFTSGKPYEFFFDARVHGNLLNARVYEMHAMENLISVLKECSYWYDKKEEMDMKKHSEKHFN